MAWILLCKNEFSEKSATVVEIMNYSYGIVFIGTPCASNRTKPNTPNIITNPNPKC